MFCWSCVYKPNLEKVQLKQDIDKNKNEIRLNKSNIEKETFFVTHAYKDNQSYLVGETDDYTPTI